MEILLSPPFVVDVFTENSPFIPEFLIKLSVGPILSPYFLKFSIFSLIWILWATGTHLVFVLFLCWEHWKDTQNNLPTQVSTSQQKWSLKICFFQRQHRFWSPVAKPHFYGMVLCLGWFSHGSHPAEAEESEESGISDWMRVFVAERGNAALFFLGIIKYPAVIAMSFISD